MPAKLFFVLFSLVALSSCANPRYADASEPLTARNPALTECQARFRSGTCLSYAWEKAPSDDDYASFFFRSFRVNADGSTTAEELPGRMTVMLWMPSMGHGSSPVTVERLGTGSYRASQVYFSMKGDWEIRFQLKEGSAVRDQAVIRIDL